MNHLRASILLVAGLTHGCGGSGSEPDSSTETVSTLPPDVIQEVGAAAIEAPAGFNFSTSDALTIEVSQHDSVIADGYLTVCRPEADASGTDYSQCLLRTPLAGVEYVSTLILPNDTETLELEVWSLGSAAIIESNTWRRSGITSNTVRIEL